MNQSDKCQQRKMETVVGFFAIFIFVGLFVFTVVINQEVFVGSKPRLTITFQDDVNGLSKGNSVVVRGMEVGRVKELELKDQSVVVTVMMDEEVIIYDDYKITVETASVLGGRQMLIEQGESGVPFSGELVGQKPRDLMSEATDLIHDLRVSMNQGGVLTNLQAVAIDLRGVTQKINSGSGTIGKLVNDDAIYKDLKIVASNLKDLSTSITEGKGSLGKLLSEDDKLYTDLASVAENLNTLSTRLAEGKGTLGKLLSEDETMYQDLESAVASIREVADKLANSEGTLGKLINDDAVYKEAQEVIGDVRAAIDDFRETAPVITFTSILFGAF